MAFTYDPLGGGGGGGGVATLISATTLGGATASLGFAVTPKVRYRLEFSVVFDGGAGGIPYFYTSTDSGATAGTVAFTSKGQYLNTSDTAFQQPGSATNTFARHTNQLSETWTGYVDYTLIDGKLALSGNSHQAQTGAGTEGYTSMLWAISLLDASINGLYVAPNSGSFGEGSVFTLYSYN